MNPSHPEPARMVSAADMRALEARLMAQGVAGAELMRRAGHGAFALLSGWLATLDPRHRQRLLVLAGKGNNGGDAWVVASLAAAAGWAVEVATPVPVAALPEDARHWAERRPAGLPVHLCPGALPETALPPGTVVVDGLLGTGASGPVRPPLEGWIASVNRSGLPVFSLDLPSGIDADTGEAGGIAVRAEMTAVIGAWKPGLFAETARALAGQLELVDIGIPPAALETVAAAGWAIDRDAARRRLPARPADGHKGSFGHVVLLAGSRRYPGAAVLAAEAAARSGAGKVTLLVPSGVLPILPPRPACLMVSEIGGAGFFDEAAAEEARPFLAAASAIVLGPGLGREPRTGAFVQAVLETVRVPTVLDADGLWHARPWLRDQAGGAGHLVLTPHPGEFQLLLSGLFQNKLPSGDRRQRAGALARFLGSTVLLKGLGTVVAGPERSAVVAAGDSSLAKGGTGDALAGLVAGLAAQGCPPQAAAELGAWIHGRTGETAPEGRHAMIADDLARSFGRAFKELSPGG